MGTHGVVYLQKKNFQKIVRCDAESTVTEAVHSSPTRVYLIGMDRDTLRALARCRRALLELHALRPGSRPDELEDLIEDVVAPGYRERLDRAFLESLRASERVM